MTDVFRWLIVIEVIGIAALPICNWFLATLDDRGYAVTKTFGLLIVTWIVWWTGSVAAVAQTTALGWILVAVVGGCGWAWRGNQTIAFLKSSLGIVAIEEAVFAITFLGWSLIRSGNPSLLGTEKPMDLMMLQATSHANSYPPQDLWLAGHAVNYYYFGYLMMSWMGRLAGSNPLVTYNVSLALIFGLASVSAFGIGLSLTRSRGWALLTPLFIVLLGNAHSFFVQVLHGRFPWNQGAWYWESSRIVGLTPSGVATTINEFPMFSFILGDLHPHLLVIPLSLLALVTALATALAPFGPISSWANWSRLLPASIIVGSLFATNSWDFPTYLLLLVASIWMSWISASRSDLDSERRSIREPSILSGGVILLAVISFLPFYIRYRSPTTGIGAVTSVSPFGEFVQIFGFTGLLAVALGCYLAFETGLVRGLIRRIQIQTSEDSHKPWLLGPWEGPIGLLGVALILVAIITQRWVLLAAICLGCFAVALLFRRETDQVDRFVLGALALTCLLICLTETVYIRDSFAGSIFYRMNTVFKLYFQAWILIGAIAVYSVARVWRGVVSNRRFLGLGWLTLVGCGVVIGGAYTVLGPVSYYAAVSGNWVSFHPQDLSGMNSFAQKDPEDYAAISWIQKHIHGSPIVLEATGPPYSTFARVSTFTGLPTLLGWQDHEEQWRGPLPILEQRQNLVNKVYTARSPATAQMLLMRNRVSLVYVGPCERVVYGEPSARDSNSCPDGTPVPGKHDLGMFSDFMRVLYHSDGVSIYRSEHR